MFKIKATFLLARAAFIADRLLDLKKSRPIHYFEHSPNDVLLREAYERK